MPSSSGNKVDVSLVIPAYNEAARLPDTLRRVIDYFERQSYRWEVIVVDDGSADGTASVCGTFGRKVRLIRNGINMGKGCSVARGMLAARGGRAVFADADLAAPAEEVGNILAALESADVAIGRRRARTGQGIFREVLGMSFARLTRAVTGLPFADTQCGLKGFTGEAARAVFARLTCRRFAFDVEVLMLAREIGLNVVEVPVIWRHVPGSTVSPVRDGWRMFVDVWRLRGRLRGGLHSGGAAHPAGAGGMAVRKAGGGEL